MYPFLKSETPYFSLSYQMICFQISPLISYPIWKRIYNLTYFFGLFSAFFPSKSNSSMVVLVHIPAICS